jgi:tol-pal system protein YbgF
MRKTHLVGALGVLLMLPGCVATKQDIRTMQEQMLQMQAHQDSSIRLIERQNRILLDTLRRSMSLTLDARGQTSHGFDELNGLLESSRQLNGQILETARQLFTRIDALEAKLQAMSQAQLTQPQATPAGGGGMSASQMYDTGIGYMRDSKYGSARTAFQAIVRTYHEDPSAPDAQFQIGESYVAEESYDDAYKAFDKVAAEWPAAPRAGEALYRAGKVAEDQKDWSRARKYYNQVVQRYPDFSKVAQAGLKRIPK